MLRGIKGWQITIDACNLGSCLAWYKLMALFPLIVYRMTGQGLKTIFDSGLVGYRSKGDVKCIVGLGLLLNAMACTYLINSCKGISVA